MLQIKPVVYYDKSRGARIRLGSRAMVVPINHTSELVSNDDVVITSQVLSFSPDTGEFETQNTVYKPTMPCQIDAMPSLPMSLMRDNDY